MQDDQITESKKRSIEYLDARELSWKLKSKADFVTYLDKHKQYYLPDENVINKDFLKEVLAGKKQLLKKSQYDPITVPHFDELSVRTLWPQLKKDAAFTQYFPTTFPKDKGPPREYFFNILNTLYPDYLAQIMAHASKQRMSAEGEDNKKSAIEISKYWEEELKDMPYVSQKPGKTLYLLKSSSKAIAKGKKRKVVPLLGSIGEYKDSKKKPHQPDQAQQKREAQNQPAQRSEAQQMNIDSMLMQPTNLRQSTDEAGKKKK